jgi:hypothetical protein
MEINETYIIVRHLARLSNGYWAKELNLVSWRGRMPKYDLRAWTADRSKMGKGVSLSCEEVIALRDALNGLNLD